MNNEICPIGTLARLEALTAMAAMQESRMERLLAEDSRKRKAIEVALAFGIGTVSDAKGTYTRRKSEEWREIKALLAATLEPASDRRKCPECGFVNCQRAINDDMPCAGPKPVVRGRTLERDEPDGF